MSEIDGGTPRPLLRPGWQAARFDDHHLQVGLDAPARVVLPDSAEVRRLLTDLSDAEGAWAPPVTLPAMRALERLRRAGLVVPVPGSALEARVAAEYGASAPARLAARRAATVAVDAPADLAGTLAAMLRSEGVEPVGDPAADPATGPATVMVVVARGPVRRGRLDELVRHGRPHLVVSGSPSGWEVGPFVVPGRTACLRCVDATRSESDPHRAVVVDQLARSSAAVPVSPTLEAAALALAVRQLISYADGEVPATWSASLVLGTSGVPELRSWTRHPLCGCAWDLVLTADVEQEG
jgi:hypothetical protein